ncbi:MAG: Gldg family protein [Planctomycetia bacterium]
MSSSHADRANSPGSPGSANSPSSGPAGGARSRSQQVASLSLLASGLFLLVVILLNVVAARTSARVDLTEEGLYTLSPGTRALLARLPDPAAVRVFWGGLEASSELVRRKYAALLSEMEEASDGRLTVRWVDVSSDAGKDEARDAGVQKYMFRQRVGDKVVNQEGYSALVVQSGARPPVHMEALIHPRRERQFEYLVASALVSAGRRTQKVLAVIDGSASASPMGGGGRGRFETLKKDLRGEYGDIVQTWHSLAQPLAENIETLLLLAPSSLGEAEAYHLEQFLLRGGRVLACLDPVNFIDYMQAPTGEAQASGLEGWLEHVGVSVGTTVAAESTAALDLVYPVWSGSQVEVSKSGYWFKVEAENLDGQHPALGGMPPFAIYWPAALSVDGARQAAAGRKVTVLASTSAGGVRVGDMDAIRRGELPKGLTPEKIPLALLVEGPLESMWQGKPEPGAAPPPQADLPVMPGLVPGAGDGVPPEPAEPAAPAPAAPAPAEPAPAQPAPSEPAPGPKGAPGEDAPAAPAAPGAAPGAAGAAPAAPAGPQRLDSGSIRLVLLSDADVLSDYLGQDNGLTLPPPFGRGLGTGGKVVGANLLDWLMGDDALLSLRTKAARPRVIERPEDSTRNLLQLLNLSVVPLLVGFTGLVVFLRRRSQG